MANKTLEYLLTIKDEATKTLQKFSGEAKNIGKNLEDMGRTVSDAGVGFAKIGAAGVAGLGLATKSAMDFDSQLRNIQSISKSTESEIQSMGKTFIGLSKELPQTATQLAEGFYNIQGSGFAGADALKVLDASARAASAGLTTTEASSYAITSALNAYGMGADQAKNVSDTLFKTVDIGVVSFEQLSGTIGDVLGTAANMNVGIDQVGAAIAGMTKKGIGAAEATTSLNATILGFMKPSEAMADAMNALGYESGQAMLKEMDLGQAIMAVRKHAEDNGQTVNDLFGNVRALKGVLALTGDEAVGFSEDLKLMQGATEGVGATQLAFQEQAKGAAFQAKIFANNLSAIGIVVGNSILPALNDFLAKITPVIQKFAEFAEKHPKLIVGILALVASFAVLGGILIFIGQMIMAVGAIMPVLGVLATGLGGALGILGSVLAFLVSPIGLVILAIAGLIAIGVLLWKNWDLVKAKAGELGNYVKDKFNLMKESISGFVNGVLDKLKKFKDKVFITFEAIKNVILFGDVGVEGIPFFSNFLSKLEEFRNNVVNKITGIFQTIKDIFTGAIALIFEGDFTGEFGRALGISEDSPIIAGILWLRDQVISAFQTMIEGVKMAIMPFIWIWENLVFPILFLAFAIITRVIYEIALFIWTQFQFIWNVISTIFTAIYEFTLYIWNTIYEFLSMIFTSIYEGVILPMMTLIHSIITTFWNAVKTLTETVWNAIKTFLSSVFNAIVGLVTSLWNSAVAIFTSLWNSVKNIFNGIANTIKQWITQAKEWLDSTATQAKEKVLSIFNALWEGLKAIGQRIYDAIVEPFMRAKAKIEEIASAIKEAARKISPFHKESPSLVELVQSGMGKIKQEYASLNRINIPSAQDLAGVPSFGPLTSGIGSTPIIPSNTNTTNVNVEAVINTPMDAEEFALILGNQLSVSGTY